MKHVALSVLAVALCAQLLVAQPAAGPSLSVGVYTTLQGYDNTWSSRPSPQFVRTDPVRDWIHVVFNSSATSGAQRRTVYARSTDAGLTWTPSGGQAVPAGASGHPSLDLLPVTGEPLVAVHHTPAVDLVPGVFVGDDQGLFTDLAPFPSVGGDSPVLPYIAGTAGGTVVVSGSTVNAPPPPAGAYVTVSNSTFTDWAAWQAVGNGATQGFPLAADPSGRVGTCAWRDSLVLFESANNGVTWATGGVVYPALRVTGGETLAVWPSGDIVYRNGTPFVALVTAPSNDGSVFTARGTRIEIWNPLTGLSVAAPYDSLLEPVVMPAGSDLPKAGPAIGVSGPAIVVAYTQYLANDNTIDSVTGARFAEIFLVRSTDGGATWSAPRNLTNTPQVDERFPSIAKVSPAGYADITWQEALRAEPGAGDLRRQVFYRHDLSQTVDVPEGAPVLPGAYALLDPYPNPFNPGTIIGFELPDAGQVQLEVTDLLGRSVALLLDDRVPAGRHEVRWDASSSAAGVYLSRLVVHTPDGTRYTMVKKMLLLR
jgi:hypothetical protein